MIITLLAGMIGITAMAGGVTIHDHLRAPFGRAAVAAARRAR